MNTEANRKKLRALVKAFDLSPTAIAQATDVSRPYIARLLSEKDDFSGSPQFWASIERSLGKIIEARRGQVFDVAALPAEGVLALTNAA
jgi:predicted transcriptional regulator